MIAEVEHTSMQRLARSLSSTYTNFSVWTFPNSAYGTIVVNHVYRGLAAYRFERQDCDDIAIAIFCYIALHDGSVVVFDHAQVPNQSPSARAALSGDYIPCSFDVIEHACLLSLNEQPS